MEHEPINPAIVAAVKADGKSATEQYEAIIARLNLPAHFKANPPREGFGRERSQGLYALICSSLNFYELQAVTERVISIEDAESDPATFAHNHGVTEDAARAFIDDAWRAYGRAGGLCMQAEREGFMKAEKLEALKDAASVNTLCKTLADLEHGAREAPAGMQARINALKQELSQVKAERDKLRKALADAQRLLAERG